MAVVQRLARPVAALAARVVGRKFPDMAGLFTAWPEVVGAAWAERAVPLGWKRRGGPNGRLVLELSVAPGQGLLVQHEAPVLLARINMYLGGQSVTELKIRQQEEETAPPRARVLGELPPLPVEGIENPDLARALGRLGAAIRESERKR